MEQSSTLWRAVCLKTNFSVNLRKRGVLGATNLFRGDDFTFVDTNLQWTDSF